MGREFYTTRSPLMKSKRRKKRIRIILLLLALCGSTAVDPYARDAILYSEFVRKLRVRINVLHAKSPH